VNLKIHHYWFHLAFVLLISVVYFFSHIVFGGGEILSSQEQSVGINESASLHTNAFSLTDSMKTSVQNVPAAGEQKFVSHDGTKTLVLNWENQTFSKSVRIENVRVGSGTESADRVEMASAKIGGVSALGESAAAKKIRVRNNEGSFRQEGATLVLVVTEGFCPEGKVSRLRFCDDGQSLVETNSTDKLCLETNTKK
jgi:hypothetical protein